MDLNLTNKIMEEKKIKISKLPDDLDIESLPKDTEIIIDEEFPELKEDFWEDDE